MTNPPTKHTRRDDIPFDFKKHCIFCGFQCSVVPDPKNPERWKKNKGMLCRTADRGDEMMPVKETLLEVIRLSNVL